MTLLFHASKAYVDLPRKIGFILLLTVRETTGCDQGKGIALLQISHLFVSFRLKSEKLTAY